MKHFKLISIRISRILLIIAGCTICQSLCAETYNVQLVDSDTRDKFINVEIGSSHLQFYFDAGCSSTAINKHVLDELDKQGLVEYPKSENQTEVLIANGERQISRPVLIKEMNVGGYTFKDVIALVGIQDREDAPMLFGQSLLERVKWYKVQGLTLSFEPYDEEFQHVLSETDFHWQDQAQAERISNLLMPYFSKGELSCFYTYKLLYALHQTTLYSDALDVIEYIRRRDDWHEGHAEFDLAEVEAMMYYNIGVDAYNYDKYDEAIKAAEKAEAAAKNIKNDADREKRLNNAGTLFWYIYVQVNPRKAKAYEKYKQ